MGRDDAVILMDSVSVRYRLALEPPLSLKESLIRRRRRRIVHHLAVDALTLAVRRGETLGIIGGNGAGKTTLLNVIARIIHPSSGRLRVRGQVVPLIDLFSGLHPELTGRENVYLRGAFLGISRRRMRARVDEIGDFAELGQFFDASLRTYSAGMIVRLAFAVITAIDGDIFVIDEALSVGDAEFQLKCAARIAELHAGGGTFVIVSHDLPRLSRLCDRVLWLEHGKAKLLGEPAKVIDLYVASQAEAADRGH